MDDDVVNILAYRMDTYDTIFDHRSFFLDKYLTEEGIKGVLRLYIFPRGDSCQCVFYSFSGKQVFYSKKEILDEIEKLHNEGIIDFFCKRTFF